MSWGIKKTTAAHSYGTTTSSTAGSYSYGGYRSIDRSKPMKFDAFEYKGFYPGYYSRYSDQPPVQGVEAVLNKLETGLIPGEQIGDLTQWVLETAGHFMRHGDLSQSDFALIRSRLWDVGSTLALATDAIFRRMRRDGGILPLKIIEGWWKQEDVNTRDGWITQPAVSTDVSRVLTSDTKWPHQKQGTGLIFDIGLPGNLYIAYTMRRDDDDHRNVYGIPAYKMADYMEEGTDSFQFQKDIKSMIKIMVEIEKRAAHEKAEAGHKMYEAAKREREAAKEKQPGHVPTKSENAKYDIGMFG